MGIGGLFVALGFFAFGTVRPPIGNYLVMLGGQLVVFFVLFRLVESRGKGEQFANNPVVKHFRLWGMISLTLFVLDILDMLPRLLFGLSYNWLFSTNINTIQGHVFGSGQEYLAIIYAVFAILFYELVIYLWSKVNFYLSFEWIIVQVVGAITKTKTRRLDVKMMMNDVHWISFEQAEKEKQKPIQTPV
jgi:hypothetical protein